MQRQSTLVARILKGKGYKVLRVKFAYRERYFLVTLPTKQAQHTPKLVGEILPRETAYGFHGRIPEKTWLKIDPQLFIDNQLLVPNAPTISA